MLLLALVPMWAFVLGEIRHERALAGAAARKDAMNLATAFEAHVRSTIRLMLAGPRRWLAAASRVW